MDKEFKEIDGKLYYFNQAGNGSDMNYEGVMATESKTIYGTTYNFGSDGAISSANGFVTGNDKTYYFATEPFEAKKLSHGQLTPFLGASKTEESLT
ncbi:hypothetical protein BK708_14170 [Bacillus thuringiensis serovar yunnanensis]|nr:hypothetical protein BK708_14170 [Bacillus thuringiensis serovar yunnanensis]